jgi:hypothetical protein
MSIPLEDAGQNILEVPYLTIRDEFGAGVVTVPALLARLLTGPEIHDFPNLAAEQHGYFWRFAVRCAAKALHDLGFTVDEAAGHPDLADAITRALAAATPEGAWELYQPDPHRPGFLQSPIPGGKLAEGNYSAHSLRLLTSALGIKNHERKFEIGRELDAERTIFALVEYQIGAIFGGSGNYASQLMGSAVGAGSGTPFMGARIGGSNGETFRHDVAVMLRGWDRIRETNGLEGNVWALWAEPWDGTGSLPSRRLDPAFIPTARLVRLGAPEDGVFRTVWFRPTKRARVEDLTGGGNLGDPFTPLVPDPNKAGIRKVRGTLGKGYDYTEVVRLLFGEDAERSPSVEALRESDDGTRPDLAVLFQGVAYEQGKTGGFHRREVLLPPSALPLFDDPDPVRTAHAEMLGMVRDAKSALRGAARIFLNGEPRPRDGDAGRVDLPALALEARVDPIYLAHLFGFAERQGSGDTNWRWEWGGVLRDLARDAFEKTLPALPASTARLYEREVEAWSYLSWKLRQLADPDSVLAGAGDEPEPEEVTA